MNKQEAKQKLHELAFVKMNTKPDDLKLADVMQIVDQIDETEKPVIPQFVADWIEKCKTFKNFAVSLSFALQSSAWEANRLSDECIEWLSDAENQDLFARAWLDGYDVEQEKQYKVKLSNGQMLGKYYLNNGKLSPKFIYTGRDGGAFTRQELEDAGFCWVFDCEGVEVQEV